MSNYHTGTVSLSIMSIATSFKFNVFKAYQLCLFAIHKSKSIMCQVYFNFKLGPVNYVNYVYYVNIPYTCIAIKVNYVSNMLQFQAGACQLCLLCFPYTRIAIKVKYTSISSWGLSIMSTQFSYTCIAI